jgi:putative addiction module component (TIGR02574 family)
MKRDAHALLEEALGLPEHDRAELAGELLDSIGPSAESLPHAEIETAWRQEVAARVAAVDAGELQLIPWEEVRDRLLARLSDRRAS